MKSRSLAIPALVLASLAACKGAQADGPIHWLTDSRGCSANFSGNGSGSSWDEPTSDFAPFQGAADILATNGLETWSAHCTQFSDVDVSSASFDAWSAGTLMANTSSNPLLSQSQAKFDAYFTIDAPMDYRLSGEVTETGYAESLATVRLMTVQGLDIESVASSTDTARTFQRAGTLQPGTYRLYAEAKGKCRTMSPLVFSHGDATCIMSFDVSPAVQAPPPRPTMTSSTGGAPRRP